ncbi:MAG TPA: hypothetical protein VIK86_03510 [Candidatus Paceibacterota bacterium]
MASIYTPVYISLENQAIDTTLSTNKVTATIRGTAISYKYQIYDNSNNNLMYDSGKQTLSPALSNGAILTFTLPYNVTTTMVNGQDYKLFLNVYSNNSIATGTATAINTVTPDNITLAVNTKPDNFYVGYWIEYGTAPVRTRRIVEYKASTRIAYLDSNWIPAIITLGTYTIVQMAQASNIYFKSRANATLTDTTILPVTQNNVNITANYVQADGSDISYYNINVYDSAMNIIKASGDTYSQIITMNVDGLISGNTYYKDFTAVTEDGVTVSIAPTAFTVVYYTPAISALVTATPIYDQDAIYIDWSGVSDIQGIASPADYYEFITNFVDTGLNGLRIFDTQKTVGDLSSGVYSGYLVSQFATYNYNNLEMAYFAIYR